MISQESIDETKVVRRIAIWALSLTALAIGALMASPLGKQAAMPGPLSSNHAHLRETCQACHVDAADAFQSVWHGIEITALDQGQSALCLDCHAWGEHALRPHGWSQAERLERQGELNLAQRFSPSLVPLSPDGELSCGTCHREHRGRDFVLDSLGDARCQACHQTKFDAFESGHPEFEDYPQRRRSRLVFDHTSHILEHFRGEELSDAPSACTSCHAMDASGRRMPLVSFEAACAACHVDDIRGASQLEGAGLLVFGLPALDTLTLEEEGHGIGQWPADSGITEVGLSPFLELLLGADPALAADLAQLEALDLLDLSAEDDAALQAVARVAWGIKSTLAAIDSGGHAALIELLEAATGRSIDLERTANLLAGLPEDLVSQALGLWLPLLGAELESHRTGSPLPGAALLQADGIDLDQDQRHEAWVQSGGWFLQGMDYGLRYRPIGHADPFLTAWLELAAQGGPRTRALFDHLARTDAEGTCVKCHSVEARGELLSVQWNADLGDHKQRALTRFSHVSHFAMATDNACALCHTLKRDNEGWGATYAAHDPSAFVPSFLPMRSAECASCHNAEGAPAECSTCHTYHPQQERQSAPGALLSLLHAADQEPEQQPSAQAEEATVLPVDK